MRKTGRVTAMFFVCAFLMMGIPTAAKAETKVVKVSAAGDCTLSSDRAQPVSVNFFSMYKRKSPGYFFKKVKSIFEQDDLSIVNFEGTLSNRGIRANKKWAFRGKPGYTKILTLGNIEAVGLANNHIRDYGEVSYQDTKKALKKAGIAYSSAENVALKEINGIRVAMVSVSGLDGSYNPVTKLRELLKKAKKKKPQLLIVSMHCGTEYAKSATGLQETLAHIAVDEGGADLVLGHHPHVIQGIEKRKGAYIVYSLGNFCFGGNTNPRDKDSMIFQQSFVFENGKLKIKKSKATVIPCRLSSSDSINNYQPIVAKGKKKKQIFAKLNSMSVKYKVRIGKKGGIS